MPRFLLTLVLLSHLAACRSLAPREPEPLAAPALAAVVAHRVGTPLGAVEPAGAVARLDTQDTLGVTLRATWRELAPRGGEALATRARLVSAERGGEALESRSALAAGGRVFRELEAQRVLADPAASRSIEAASAELALPRGVTGSLALLSEQTVLGPDGKPERRELRVEVGRALTGELSVALVLESVVSSAGEDDAAPSTLTRRESILLEDVPQPAGAPLVISLPIAEEASEARALLLSLEAQAQAAEGSVERCLSDAEAAERDAQARTTWLDGSEARRREIESALRSLGELERRRAALVFLSAQSGAELCGDVALCASEELLAKCSDELARDLPDAAQLARDGASLGWALERATSRFLAARAAQQPLEPELLAALLRRTGELGRSPAALAEVTAKCRTLAEFQDQLAAENRVLLEDSHPAARVRAFDWLAARRLAPAGYDPLGPADERRAALEALEATEGRP